MYIHVCIFMCIFYIFYIEFVKMRYHKQSYVQCRTCRAHLNRASFNRVKMKHWIENGHLARDALCLFCEAKNQTKKGDQKRRRIL